MRKPPRGRLRYGHPEILAQCAARIFLAEQATILELRYDEAHEVLISSRNVGSGYDKAVAGTLDKPWFELVGDLLRPRA